MRLHNINHERSIKGVQQSNKLETNIMSNDNNTTAKQIETSRTFKIVEKQSFSLPPQGVFSARLASLAFIGTYTKTFTNKDGTKEEKNLELVGLSYQFTDLNTGELSEALVECVLSYHPDSRLYGNILALNNNEPLAEGAGLDSLLNQAVRIEIIHQTGTDKQGNSRQYASIKSVTPLGADMKQPDPLENTCFYDIQAHNDSSYDALNGKHRWMIENRSHEKGVKLTQSAVEERKPEMA